MLPISYNDRNAEDGDAAAWAPAAAASFVGGIGSAADVSELHHRAGVLSRDGSVNTAPPVRPWSNVVADRERAIGAASSGPAEPTVAPGVRPVHQHLGTPSRWARYSDGAAEAGAAPLPSFLRVSRAGNDSDREGVAGWRSRDSGDGRPWGQPWAGPHAWSSAAASQAPTVLPPVQDAPWAWAAAAGGTSSGGGSGGGPPLAPRPWHGFASHGGEWAAPPGHLPHAFAPMAPGRYGATTAPTVHDDRVHYGVPFIRDPVPCVEPSRCGLRRGVEGGRRVVNLPATSDHDVHTHSSARSGGGGAQAVASTRTFCWITCVCGARCDCRWNRYGYAAMPSRAHSDGHGPDTGAWQHPAWHPAWPAPRPSFGADDTGGDGDGGNGAMPWYEPQAAGYGAEPDVGAGRGKTASLNIQSISKSRVRQEPTDSVVTGLEH